MSGQANPGILWLMLEGILDGRRPFLTLFSLRVTIMNAPLECFTPHLSGKVVFRIMCLVTLRLTFDFDVKDVHMQL